MTASTLSHLPLMAGSALLDVLGRGAGWTFARYMRAPLASTALLAMVSLTALAGSNALYFQTAEHPSPFFAPAAEDVVALPTPVEAAPRQAVPAMQPMPEPVTLPAVAPVAQPAETTGSIAETLPDAPVGNTQMFEVQKKLYELQLFSGKVDGYYGPKTAEAIRAFELRNGMTPTGSTEASVLEAILSSDASGRLAQPQAVAPAQPLPAPVAQEAVVAPQPVAPAPVAQPDQVVARVAGLTRGEEAFDTVAQSAANTIDSIIADVDAPRTGSVTPVANAPVPPAVLPVGTSQPRAAPVVAIAEAAPTALSSLAPSPSPQTQVAAAALPYVPPASDGELVAQIQRGLASLGFFRAQVDGKPSAETARAIREFENFYSYQMTGQVKPDLVDLLLKAGATI